jgi:hypothetical protein
MCFPAKGDGFGRQINTLGMRTELIGQEHRGPTPPTSDIQDISTGEVGVADELVCKAD